MITREQIVAEAQSWMGTKWCHQACVKGAGVDCIGLIAGVADALGIPEAKAWRADMRFRGYGITPESSKLLEAVALYLDPIPRAAAKLGDILIFAYVVPDRRIKLPIHFGIISRVNPEYVIHAYAPEPVNRVCENIISGAWEKRVHSARRYRGIA